MTHVPKDEYRPYREALDGDYSVRHKRTHSNEKSQYHIHSEFEVFLSLSPGLVLDTGGKTYALPPHSLLLFNNMDLHLLTQSTPGAENDRYVVYFKPEYIHGLSTERTDLLECFMLRPTADANIIALDAETAQALAAALDRIIALEGEQAQAPYGNDLQIKMLLADYLLRINRLYRARHGITEAKTQSGYRTVYAIINHLHQHYADEVSLDQLARAFFIDKFYLCTLFREITGMPPRQYLIKCRLMKARELLLHGMAVEPVCARVGYNNLSHFSRAFKNEVGVSPKQYQMNAAGEAAGKSRAR